METPGYRFLRMSLPPRKENLIVIKYGGSLLEEPGHRSAFLKQVAALAKQRPLVLVHGGGKEITRAMEKAGLQARFVDGRRYTDDATMAVVERVLAGLNKEIVGELKGQGASPEGFSGRFEHLAEATPVSNLGRAGENLRVDGSVLGKILARTALPVFYSVAEDARGEPLNINADDFALALAMACGAGRLVFLTDSGGILGTDGRRIERIDPAKAQQLMDGKVVTGGMIVKVQACIQALRAGVGSVDIVKGIDHLLSGAPAPGTVFLL